MEFPIHTTSPSSLEYPELLREISYPPDPLYYRGALPTTLPAVAIVGTRKASAEACSLARETAECLSRNGFAVVSGLAFGVDASAHEGALRGGAPTFAVLANGLSNIYPREHERLARNILQSGGGILSEYKPDTVAFRHQFLERNRIISGCSIAIVLIEVPIHSGALSTARHATLQGRDVLVFANRPSNHRYEGSYMLLREGARFVASGDDVLQDMRSTLSRYPQFELFPSFSASKPSLSFSFQHDEERRIYDELCFANSPLTVDKLAETTTLDVQLLNRILTDFLLSGIVREEGGGFFVRK